MIRQEETRMKILITEDQVDTGQLLKNKLEADKHTVDWLTDGASAELAAMNAPYDVIIMDINLPRKNGIDVIKSLRKQQIYTPILILTANNKDQDCVNGLASGADDYLAKPFEYAVLYHRLNALVRRETRNYSQVLIHRDLELDPQKHTVKFKGNICHLPLHEYKLLKVLMETPDRPISRERLHETLYDWDDEVVSNVMEVNIHNIRRLFGKDYIRTIRGIGYQIN